MIRTTLAIALALSVTIPWASAAPAGNAAPGAAPQQMDANQLSAELEKLRTEVRQAMSDLRALKGEDDPTTDANDAGALSDEKRARVIDRINKLLSRQDRIDDRIDSLFDHQRELEAKAAPQTDKPSPERGSRFDYRYEGEPASRWPSPEPVVDTRPRSYESRTGEPDSYDRNDTRTASPTLSPHYTTHDKSYYVRSIPARPSVGPAIRVGATYRRGGYSFSHHTYTHWPRVHHRVGWVGHWPHHGFHRYYRYHRGFHVRHHFGSHVRIYAGGVHVIWR